MVYIIRLIVLTVKTFFEFFLASFQNDPVPCKSILLNRVVNVGELLTIDGYTTLLDRTGDPRNGLVPALLLQEV